MLLIAPLLLSSFAFLAPVHAPPATGVSVSPATNIVDVGSMFTFGITASNVQNLASYDITLSFDETQLEWDSSLVADPFVPAIMLKLPGSIRVAGVIFDGSISGSALLVSHTFRIDLPGVSALDISQSGLGALGAGQIAHTADDGSVQSQFKSSVKLNTARASGPTVDLSKSQIGMTLQANIANNGMTDVHAFVAWRLVTQSGLVFGINSATVIVPAGLGLRADTFFGVEAVPDTFVGSAALFVSEDGVNFSVSDVRNMQSSFSVIP